MHHCLYFLNPPKNILHHPGSKNIFTWFFGGKVCNYLFSPTQRPAFVFPQENCLIFIFEMSYKLYFFNWTTKATSQCAFETILTHGCCTKIPTHMLCIMQSKNRPFQTKKLWFTYFSGLRCCPLQYSLPTSKFWIRNHAPKSL